MTLALLIAPLLLGADPAPAPKLVTAAVAKVDDSGQSPWVEITADPILTTLASPTAAKWVQVDPECRLKPAPDGKTAVFAAPKAGRYRLVVVPEAGEPIRVAVMVGKVDPAPPTPDAPAPPSPVPEVSVLGKRLQVAFDSDVAPRPDKLRLLADKTELYRQAAVLAAVVEITTTGQLVQRVKDASKALGGDGLSEVRKVVSGELAAAMPTDEPMTVELRAKAAVVFNRIKSALQEVK